MLKSWAPRLPPRTPRTNLQSYFLDGNRSQVIFNPLFFDASKSQQDSSRYLRHFVSNTLPPCQPPPRHWLEANCSLCPPFHIHLKEDEIFHVLKGTARFAILNPRTHRLHVFDASSGEHIEVPRGHIHTFRNGSSTEPLTVEFSFLAPPISSTSESSNDPKINSLKFKAGILQSPAIHAKLHRFFLNAQQYRADCAASNIRSSLLQTLLFNYDAGIVAVSPLIFLLFAKWPFVQRWLYWPTVLFGRTVNFFGGVVLGKWILGLRSTYPEYYPYDYQQLKKQMKQATKVWAQTTIAREELAQRQHAENEDDKTETARPGMMRRRGPKVG